MFLIQWNLIQENTLELEEVNALGLDMKEGQAKDNTIAELLDQLNLKNCYASCKGEIHAFGRSVVLYSTFR